MDYKVIPVVVIEKASDTRNVMRSLVDGGLPVAEICFRTDCALDAIKIAVKEFPQAYVGAGTVINAEQCRAALSAGAKFIVSPGLSEEVAAVCRNSGVPYYPGCVTPTEIMRAVSLGITTVKFFPAGAFGGLKTIKALAAAFPSVKFLPTGGVDLSNLKEFLSFDAVAAVGGSFMMKGDVTANCKAINEALKEVK